MRTPTACNSHPICHLQSLTVYVLEDFQSIFAVNTFGPYYFSRALVRSWLGLHVYMKSDRDPIDVANMKNVGLKKQILFVSSISALVAWNPQR